MAGKWITDKPANTFEAHPLFSSFLYTSKQVGEKCGNMLLDPYDLKTDVLEQFNAF